MRITAEGTKWDAACHAMLLWLSRERWSLRHECVPASALATLIEAGFAEVLFEAKEEGNDGIALTAMGWARVARVQERERQQSHERGGCAAMADSVDLISVIRLGIDMRRAQRRYFRAPTGSPEKRAALEQSKQAERAFDLAAAKVVTPALELGGGDNATGH